MADIRFNCPKCSQKLVIDAAGAGLAVQCPTCTEMVEVPDPNQELKQTQKVVPFAYARSVTSTAPFKRAA
jgi:phage FluMu protein Com